MVWSGVIVDKWGKQSPQVDLVIYDKRLLPPILEEFGHGIYPFDSTLRIIEVKSTLQKSDLIQLHKLCESVDPKNPNGLKTAEEGNLPNGKTYYPFVSLIAYDTKISDLEKVVATTEPSLKNYIAQICVLTKGVIKTDAEKIIPNKDNKQNVRLFLTILLAMIESSAASRKEFSVIKWMFNNR